MLTAIFTLWYTTTIIADRRHCIAGGIALSMFVLWVLRRGEAIDRLSRDERVHFFVGLALMVAALVKGPWIGLMGALVLLHGLLRSEQDGDRKCSLSYLVLIPIVCIGMPVDLSDRISKRMGVEAVRITGLLLDQAEILHDRNRTTIFSARGEATIADASTDFACAAVFMACASVLLCVLRRRLMHSVVALLVAALFSLMTSIIVLYIWAAMPGLDDGVAQRLPNYCFVATLLLFVIAEQGLAVLTRSIPMVSGSIARGHDDVNPCVVFWNDLTLSRSGPEVRQRRKLPTMRSILIPQEENVRKPVVWPLEWFGAWFTSRKWFWLIPNAPFVLVLALAGYGCLKLEASMSHTYQAAIEQAMRDNSAATAGFVLQRLEKEGVADLPFQHEFVLQVVSEGRPEIASPFVERLTSFEHAGYPPTRKWLVHQARQPKPVFPLSPDERVRHLNVGIKFHPNDADYLQGLAQECVDAGQLSLAEPLMERAAESNPALVEGLIRLKLSLGRGHNAVLRLSEEYAERLEQELARPGITDTEQEDASIALAFIYTRQGRSAAAEAVLMRDPVAIESARVRSTLSVLYTTRAVRLFAIGQSNAEAQAVLVKAIEFNSANVLAAANLYQLSKVVGVISSPEITSAIETLRRRMSAGTNTHANRMALVNLLGATGEREEAIALLRATNPRPPGATVVMIRLLQSAGRVGDVSQLLGQLHDELVSDSAAVIPHTSVSLMASAYAAAERYGDGIQFVDMNANVDAAVWPQALRQVYADSLLAQFDASVHMEGNGERLGEFQVLKKAITTLPLDGRILERLINLSSRKSAEAGMAKAYLSRRLADPVHMHTTRQAMGLAALYRADYEEALTLLRRCVEQGKGNVALLNNLAVACVRSSVENAPEALGWIERALQRAPAHIEFKATRAEVMIALERWDDAQRDVEAVLEADPDRQDMQEMRSAIESHRAMSAGS